MSKKSTPMLDYFEGKSGVWFPRNPYGYFTLMGQEQRRKELEAQKKKNDPFSKTPFWKR